MEFTPLPQSDAFDRTLQALGRQTRWVDLTCSTGQARALLVRLPVGWICSRGPVWRGHWPDDARLRALRDLRGAGVWIMNPAANDTNTLRQAGFARIMTPVTTATLPLRPDWLDNAHGKWRNSLRKARADWPAQYKIRDHAYTASTGGWLIKACQTQARARKYRDWPARFTQTFARVNPGHARVFAVRDGLDPVAGLMVLRHGTGGGGGASYHCAWANDQGRALQAHRVLLAQAIDWLTSQECGAFDLGVLNTEETPGLARFKLGTGAQATPQGGTWIKLPFAGQKAPMLSGAAA